MKFLPEKAARDQRLLERFHGEVRIARQVSHPNVCRVYDIGEYAGMPFLSMEYVDGEDLASLLTRIGRLPDNKALETARKICAGLAAAHDRGIIHRDLKPANIMIDKRGDVAIMDFGLAAIAGELSGSEARNGTPAYMAPEQLKGAEVTARSDIYALGLVLYELFTGRRPYDGTTLKKLLEQQEAAQLTSMTSIAADIDPSVETAIRRCAGETPSPKLIAAAGETEGLPLKYSVPCLVAIIIGLFTLPLLRQASDALQRAPVTYPPQVLVQKAREIAVSFGYSPKPAGLCRGSALSRRPGGLSENTPGPASMVRVAGCGSAHFRRIPRKHAAALRRTVRGPHTRQPCAGRTGHGLREPGWRGPAAQL
ncbi:MAG TPA: serine/threonine-protein kinase [Bryobacteraceae bacterium]|nr:serine/threonine-protein kinase [Bryobacteraceae bacterium]